MMTGGEYKRKGFTIVELLTVMSIIILLIALFVPGLNQAKRFARKVKQKSQFRGIDIGLDIYNAEEEGYPSSDDSGNYCGAMKLCEAMVGQDLLGYHPDSRFSGDYTDLLYDWNPLNPGNLAPTKSDNLKVRKDLALPLENANAYR